jgi:hypothetical protein
MISASMPEIALFTTSLLTPRWSVAAIFINSCNQGVSDDHYYVSSCCAGGSAAPTFILHGRACRAAMTQCYAGACARGVAVL